MCVQVWNDNFAEKPLVRSSSFFDLVRLPSMQQQLKYGGPRICGSFPTRRHQRHINRTFSWITQHVWCCWGWVWCVFFRFDVYRFLINPERYQEHFTPQKHFDSAPSRLSLLLGFGISFARARRLRKIWGTLFHGSFPSLRPVISGLMGIFAVFNSKALNSRPYNRSY